MTTQWWRASSSCSSANGFAIKTYIDLEEARRDVFDYIEMFYNPTRRPGYNNNLSPVVFEKQYFNRVESV
jgi:putative transposase